MDRTSVGTAPVGASMAGRSCPWYSVTVPDAAGTGASGTSHGAPVRYIWGKSSTASPLPRDPAWRPHAHGARDEVECMHVNHPLEAAPEAPRYSCGQIHADCWCYTSAHNVTSHTMRAARITMASRTTNIPRHNPTHGAQNRFAAPTQSHISYRL